MTLPLDRDFAIHVILRIHYQYYYYVHWLQMLPNLFQDYYGCESDFIRQVWFKEDQLPLSSATK